MSENKEWYLEDQPKPSLHRWIFGQMAVGAGWAALVFFGAILFVFVLRSIASMLPEDPFASADGVLQFGQAVTHLI